MEINYENARQILSKTRRDLETPITSTNVARRGPPNKVDENIVSLIELIVEENSAYTLKKMKEILYERSGVSLSISTINNVLCDLRVTLKLRSLVLERVNETVTL